MNYMGDSHWWNERFKLRSLNIMNHEKCLEEDIKYLPKIETVLDVACDDGRNSIYLARLGYKVYAIDFSKEALSRLKYFAEKEKLNIETKLLDLSINDVFFSLDKYDLIIINHYRLLPKLYNNLMKCLNTGGFLWVNGFREIPNDNPNITKSDVLSEEDFISLKNYKLENKKLYDIGERKFIKYIWRKENLPF
ncbi:TPA: class I SAM-dependent methyltransferase [Clostridium perfringens]|nr:methyltransferase domain-containing protein [Clostridium perfringens]HBI6919785.1 methyltransferase domain-containing protein [Clostridium perfringens]HBI7039675.1 methyltransferase domain-containing protein [Clostridium perfringens]